MYMPVEAATYGGTPIPISTGLNTIPPPNPTAEARPPPIDAAASLTIEIPVNEMSLLFHPILVFFFSVSSFWSLKICTIEMTIVIVRNEKKIIQSAALHFYIPTIEGFFFEPLKRLTKNAISKVQKHAKWIRHGKKLLLSLCYSFFANKIYTSSASIFPSSTSPLVFKGELQLID